MGRTRSSSSPLNQALKGDLGSQGHPLTPSDSHIELTRVSMYLPSRPPTHHELEGILNGPHYQALVGHFLL